MILKSCGRISGIEEMTAILAALTVLIAVVGTFIGYIQWRTAHQRVVLDLFDRRLEVFEEIEEAVKAVFSSSTVTTETFRTYVIAMSKARFLFGASVNDYLVGLQKDFAFLKAYSDDTIARDPNPNLPARKAAALQAITDFAENGPKIFGPYMRMDQKMPSVWRPF